MKLWMDFHDATGIIRSPDKRGTSGNRTLTDEFTC
jgi:hypothetical protein